MIKFKQRFINKKKLIIWISAIILVLVIGLASSVVFKSSFAKVSNLIYQKYPESVEFFRKVKRLSKITDVFYLPKTIGKSEVPQYELRIQKSDYEKLQSYLPEIVLTSEGYRTVFNESRTKTVPAVFVYDGKEYKVEVRYRGDGPSHYMYPKKSWRIIFKEPNTFNGMAQMNLIFAKDRAFLAEELSNYRAKKLGLPVLNSDIINLEVNNSNHGVYFMVEKFSGKFFNRYGFSEDINLYGGDDYVKVSKLDLSSGQLHIHDKGWESSLADKNDYTELYQLLDILNETDEEEFLAKATAIFDMENVLNFSVHALLGNSRHQVVPSNYRLFFDPESGKFMFAPWDVEVTSQSKGYQFGMDEHPLIGRLLSHPEILLERNRRTWNYLDNEENLEDDLDFYDDLYDESKKDFYKDRKKYYTNKYFDQQVKHFRNLFVANAEAIENKLKHAEVFTTVGDYSNVGRENYQGLPYWVSLDFDVWGEGSAEVKKIELTNIDSISQSFVDNLGIYLDSNQNEIFDAPDQLIGKITSVDNDLITADDFNYFMFYHSAYFNINQERETEHYKLFVANPYVIKYPVFNKVKLELRNAVTGKKIDDTRKYITARDFKYFNRIVELPEDFNKRYSFIIQDGQNKNTFHIYGGSYQVSEDIVVPKNLILIIHPGVSLFFDEGISFLSYSKVLAEGRAQAPIIFQPINPDKAWGTFAIVGQEASGSKIAHARFFKGSEIKLNGIRFTGMVASHLADISVDHSEFYQSEGDDGLNIKKAEASVTNSLFSQNSFDGFDADYLTGDISNNLFLNNGNDGLDLSGGSALVYNNHIRNSGDKCISIGEESKATLINNLVTGCAMGIAIKDLSKIDLINNTIVNNEVGIALYQKKGIFGGGQANLYNSIVWNNQQPITLADGSKISVANSDVQGGWDGENVLDIEPKFVNPENNNYGLAAENDGRLFEGNKDYLPAELNINDVPLGIF